MSVTPPEMPSQGGVPAASTELAKAKQRMRNSAGSQSLGIGYERFVGYAFRDPQDSKRIEIPPHWAVPWSDLMMVMMVMFAVMFVGKLAIINGQGGLVRREQHIISFKPSTPPPKKESSVAATKVRLAGKDDPVDMVGVHTLSLETLLNLSEKLVTEANLEDIDVALTENQAIRVSVRGNLMFDLGKADLKPEYTSFLNKLAQIIATNNFKIEVAGHTDDFPVSNPVYPTNWELSSARASQVARFLIQSGKLEPARFSVIGFSSYHPTAPNTSLENRTRNRRVEIIITRNEYKP